MKRLVEDEELKKLKEQEQKDRELGNLNSKEKL